MSEQLSEPEARLSEAQQRTLQDLCLRYDVNYDPTHYYLNPPGSLITPGWAEGWVGGPQHANPEFARPQQPAGHPTIYVGVDPEGRAFS